VAATKHAAATGVLPVQYPTLAAVALVGLGRYGEAWQSLQEEVADPAHPFGQAFRDLGVATYLVDVLAYERAAEVLASVAMRAASLKRGWMVRFAGLLRATAQLRSGRSSEVDLAGIAEDVPAYWVGNLAEVRAEALLAAGRLAEALGQADDASSAAERLGHDHDYVSSLEVKLRILLRLRRPADAVALADEALVLAQTKGYRPLTWRLRAARAGGLAALGQIEAAVAERQAAGELACELAPTIPDDELRRSYLASALAIVEDHSSYQVE
jgi:hypothetical protein